ncbi:MAG: hypothetical protein U0V48_12490 [Anaerolineales bacterium]
MDIELTEFKTKVLNVCSAIFGLIGSLLLSYDIFSGPVKWYEKNYFPRVRRQVLSEHYERLIKRYRNLPQPPYTKEEIQSFEDELKAKHDSSLQKDELEIEKEELADRLYSQKLALRGSALIALAFLLQLISIFFS